MTKFKTMYLGVMHMKQTSSPSITDLINNPIYEEDVKVALSKTNPKQPGQVKKAMQSVQKKHRKTVTKEYTFLTDQVNYKSNVSASIIIDVDNRKIIKNRFPDANLDEMINLYLERYKEDIQEFIRRFRS